MSIVPPLLLPSDDEAAGPPYVVFVGNIPKGVPVNDVAWGFLFWAGEVLHATSAPPRGGRTRHCYLTFCTPQGVERALRFDGCYSPLLDSTLRVELATSRRGRRAQMESSQCRGGAAMEEAPDCRGY